MSKPSARNAAPRFASRRRAGRGAAAAGCRAALACLILAAGWCGGSARAEAVFRPLIADPRESLSRWRFVGYTEDWRYGTDLTDSTSRGGVERDRRGLTWEVAGGNRFRWPPLRRLLGIAPWRQYQLAAPAAFFAVFDNSGALLNTDFQYGVSLESQWSGPALRDPAGGVSAEASGN